MDVLEVDDIERLPYLSVHAGGVELDAPAQGIFQLAVDEGSLEGSSDVELLVATDGDLFKLACFAKVIDNILGVTSKCGHFVRSQPTITLS